MLVSLVEREEKYVIEKVDQANCFVLDNQLWHVDPSDVVQQEDPQLIIGTLKMVVKPLHRNVENISLEMLAREIESDTAQQMELRALEKLAKNEDLIVKVQRAMNNWVRVKLENRLPSNDLMYDMVTQASSAYEGEGYNPLKCWNE